MANTHRLRICCFALLVIMQTMHATSSHADKPILVKDLQGGPVSPLAQTRKRPVVLFFITNDCPIANRYAPEIERIYRDYARNVALYLVYVDPSLSASSARAHRRDYHYTIPALLDPQHRLVRRSSATTTPEAALFDASGRLVYHGRIDDRAVAFGQVRVDPTRRDLREALDALLQGQSPSIRYQKPVGCYIADLKR